MLLRVIGSAVNNYTEIISISGPFQAHRDLQILSRTSASFSNQVALFLQSFLNYKPKCEYSTDCGPRSVVDKVRRTAKEGASRRLLQWGEYSFIGKVSKVGAGFLQRQSHPWASWEGERGRNWVFSKISSARLVSGNWQDLKTEINFFYIIWVLKKNQINDKVDAVNL